MEKHDCVNCYKLKPASICDVCQGFVCKDCVQFLEPSTFSFYHSIPEPLSHNRYCSRCYDTNVGPALALYEEILEKAKNIHFFFITRYKPVPLIRRHKEAVKVEECFDRDETILRLAFFAAELGYNAIVEAEVVSKKVRNQGYQKAIWHGKGVPALIDAEKFDRAVSGRYSDDG